MASYSSIRLALTTITTAPAISPRNTKGSSTDVANDPGLAAAESEAPVMPKANANKLTTQPDTLLPKCLIAVLQ
jgi:hypothetical protein